MRDAVDLKGKTINYNNQQYKIEDFCLVPSSGQIYIRLKDIISKVYLNVSLSSLLVCLQSQIKL